MTLDSIDDFTRYSDEGLGERGDDRIAGDVVTVYRQCSSLPLV